MNLYWEDPYRSQATTRILERRATDTGVALRLVDRLFYPESGGQPADHGTIDGMELIRLEMDEEKLWHHLSRAPEGEQVTVRIDVKRRRDHMQQHLGQHILSRAFEELAKARTIGFHMGNRTTTIDLDRYLAPETLRAAEAWSNRIIDEHRDVRSFFPTAEEKISLRLRKDPDAHETLRVVRIEGVDDAACGGTHPHNTSEVGLLKIVKSEKYKEGMRITFLCGARARDHYAFEHGLLQNLSARLGTGMETLLPRLDNLLDDLSDLRHRRDTLVEEKRVRTIETLAKPLEEKGTLIHRFEEGPDFYRPIAATLTARHRGVLLLFSVADEGYHFILACDDTSQDELQQRFLALKSQATVKGGGHRLMKQGRLTGITTDTIMQLF